MTRLPFGVSAALATAGLLGLSTGPALAADLTVTSFGGAYQDAQREVYFEPFAQETRELAREERFWKTRARLPGDWDLAGGGSYYLTAEEAREYGIVDVVREDVKR